jgi:hypothetical protein
LGSRRLCGRPRRSTLAQTPAGGCRRAIDNDDYPQTAEIESRCVHIIADLWHSPAAGTTIGCSTTGSSEAAMLDGLALKWQWRKRRLAVDVELRQILLAPEATGMLPDQVAAYCDENTIGVVPTLGITFTGAYEPVAEIASAPAAKSSRSTTTSFVLAARAIGRSSNRASTRRAFSPARLQAFLRRLLFRRLDRRISSRASHPGFLPEATPSARSWGRQPRWLTMGCSRCRPESRRRR